MGYKPPHLLRTEQAIAKATQSEYNAYKAEARRAEMSLSEYFRYWIPELNGGVIRRKRP